nr:hypothetical protein CFP56_19799 [Quercus suber]
MTFSPPTTRFKVKAKVGKCVWDSPSTALGRAHNVIIDNDLKGLSSIFSYELVLGKSLRLTMDYLSNEEKLWTSRPKPRKVKELKEALKIEKKLVIQKDKEVQAALLRIDEEHGKHHIHVADFENLDFEAIDTKILADGANEKESETIAEATKVVEEELVMRLRQRRTVLRR